MPTDGPPAKDDEARYLRELVTNGNITVEALDFKPPRRQMEPLPEAQQIGAGDADADSSAFFDKSPCVGSDLEQKELIALAMKSLGGQDRELFKMLVIEGASVAEIARRLHIQDRDAAHKRANGLLWHLRCRADLAWALGVVPEAKPLFTRPGAPLSLKKLPPAAVAG